MSSSDKPANPRSVGQDDAADGAARTSKGPDASSSSSASENCLIFGTAPSHLFDTIAITLDNLLTKEVGTLPLLPKTVSEVASANQGKDGTKSPSSSSPTPQPLTGEEKLLVKLRKVYKKNLDLVETYCSRNVFTIEYFSKTKRRKILEKFLEDKDDENNSNDDDNDGNDNTNNNNNKNGNIPPLPKTNFPPPPPNEPLPTPEQITDMDRQILLARQRLHLEKQRRVKLERLLERVSKACASLKDVENALEEGLQSENGGLSSLSQSTAGSKMKDIQTSVRKALEGHQELKAINTKAEGVIHLLDKIKQEREENDNSASSSSAVVVHFSNAAEGECATKSRGVKRSRVTAREEDERERRKMWEEMNGDDVGAASSVGGVKHEGREGINSLLKKLRGEEE